MKRFSILFFVITVIALVGCEDVIDFELAEGKPQLVVDGYVTDQTGSYAILLSLSAPYLSKTQVPKVTGAMVTIADNEGNEEILKELEPGKYVTSTLHGKIGNHYVLTIKTEGETYRAETDIKRVPEIDSLRQIFKQKTDFTDEGYYVLYYGQEIPVRGDFYRFKVYKNRVLANKPSELVVRSDKFIEGSYIDGPEMNDEPFEVGDTVRVETSSLTEDNYNFLHEVFIQINNGGMFAKSPANVRTNIINLNPNSDKKALGHFGGTAIRFKEIVIKEQK
ncbi:MAG: DUF4249 domain-containing protein [Bacteroidota bacterium]